MQFQSTHSNAQALQEQLICPVLLEPLLQAVSLVPCAHRVQQAAAEKIFGTTHGGWLVQSENPCPVCRTPVLGYMTDYLTRNIAKQLFELSENEINAMLELMKKNLIKENLADKSISVEKDVLVGMPYPGKSGRFIHNGGDWSSFYLESWGLCRYMSFKSSTKGSLLKEFSLLGYRDGAIKICLKFSSKCKDIKEYLKQFGCILDSSNEEEGLYLSKNKNELETIFDIIASNNEIFASHFNKIKDILSEETDN